MACLDFMVPRLQQTYFAVKLYRKYYLLYYSVMKPIDKAIEIAGSKTALARLLTAKRVKESNGTYDVTPISRQNVDYWRNVNLPAKVAVDIETVLSARVTRYELLPEIFGPKI